MLLLKRTDRMGCQMYRGEITWSQLSWNRKGSFGDAKEKWSHFPLTWTERCLWENCFQKKKEEEEDKRIENGNEENGLQTRTQIHEAGANSTAQEQSSEIVFYKKYFHSETTVPSRIREMVRPDIKCGIFHVRLLSLAVSSGLWKYLQTYHAGQAVSQGCCPWAKLKLDMLSSAISPNTVNSLSWTPYHVLELKERQLCT